LGSQPPNYRFGGLPPEFPQPQSGLKKKAHIKWTDEMQKVFNKMHLLMAANALAAYPNHNKRFDVYTDASDFQIGACIIQEGRPVADF
jgi:hypothetical protein